MGKQEEFERSRRAPAKADSSLVERYFATRKYTEFICEPLVVEDYVVQPSEEVSPPKWHLAHTTWFFEEVVLSQFLSGYKRFHPRYGFLFNSYYETLGERVDRRDRGKLSRPTVGEIYEYRAYVNEQMIRLFSDLPAEAATLVELGIHHEQQHQELLYTDIKFILGNNPLFPVYMADFLETPATKEDQDFIEVASGQFMVGNKGDGFSYDHEQPRHRVFLDAFKIRKGLVSNSEYLEFINAGGYDHPDFWLSDGWKWIRDNNVRMPLYWLSAHSSWYRYALSGLEKLNPDEPATHVSFYEADAFARWKGLRLPTEFEWEVASQHFPWGVRWEWTNSTFLPYPGYRKPNGAVGEYNAKFMVNTVVLRGASIVTPANHSRSTYRNFFYPQQRWQFTGIRLCK